jgi:hypothetical protein
MCPSRDENLRCVHEPVGDRYGHRDGGRPISSLSTGPSRRVRVALRAGDLEKGRHTLVAQGKITQLVTVLEVRCVVV